ncbi:S24 family peptidase [Novosphingobium flavum]|uniref:S24 family peptidase n=1 Tax=Novosphingobium flavum TaxID=1778672 RepID=A0A7X1FRD1_9SPHN|nr:S24 family peptidase [Novosphingobium flavum]MBC2664972.1 S24 family peptidase [Novosphingobium flavum]
MVTNDPRARLLSLSEEKGISLSSLSALIGRNSTYLQQFVRKGSPRKLEESDRRRLADFLGVGEAELGAPEYISRDSAPILGKRGRNLDWLDIPRLAVEASAGPGALGEDGAAIGALRFSARWLRAQGFDPAMLSAILVTGDSMEPLLRDGDEILVDRTPRPLRDGIHVVRVGEALLVKRVQAGVPGKLELKSENPAYRAIEVDPAEAEVIGRVVWKSGRL